MNKNAIDFFHYIHININFIHINIDNIKVYITFVI